ncbi:MAG: hypothetical protein CM1200mP2_57230 [Planctomycetaceae bacterium]|nr:MAG: hypothetical protein CM1200mP2_57230 [Planctomycetaceae bacterium]
MGEGRLGPPIDGNRVYRSNTIQVVRENYGVVLPKIADLKRMAPGSYAYRFQYRDGTRATAWHFGRRRDRGGFSATLLSRFA